MNQVFMEAIATGRGGAASYGRWTRRLCLGAVALLVAGFGPARADDVVTIEPRAVELMKRMSEFTQRQLSFRIAVETTLDEMEEGQLIQSSQSKTIAIRRPDKMCVVSKGDGQHRHIWFDGKALTMCDVDLKVHATRESPGTINEMMDRYEEKCGHTMPMADLLRTDIQAAMMANVTAGRYVGLRVVGTRSCHHLAFQQEELDWQIWIDDGAQPLTRKLVITYKLEPGAPQYTAVITSWELAPPFASDAFSADIPVGSEQIVIHPMPEPQTQKEGK